MLKTFFKEEPQIVENKESLPWIDVALKEMGTKEKVGGENPRIIEYHSATTLKAKEDEVPWCSAFVSWCLEKSGTKSTKNAWARSYLGWGVKLDKPKFGCVLVFSRGKQSGHVGFYVGENLLFYKVLGGNQNNSVSVASYPKFKLLGARWPLKN
jgi:uncharacterized protein (TIGR02594 family)